MIRRLALAALVVGAGRAGAQPVQPIADRAVQTLNLPGFADFLAVADSEAWVTNRGRVEKLRFGAPGPIATVPVSRPCGGMEIAFGSLWVMDCRERALVRINRAAPAIEATIATGLADNSGEISVAAGAGSIWVLTDTSGVLSRIDPATNTVVARVTVKPRTYAAVFGFGAVWVTNTGVRSDTGAGSVQRIDPATNAVTATIPVGSVPRFLAAGAGGVWVLNQRDGSVSRINPATNRVEATIPVGASGGGGDIAAAAGRVWVRGSKMLLATIDPATNQVSTVFGPPAGSGAVRGTDALVWVTAHDIQTAWVIRP